MKGRPPVTADELAHTLATYSAGLQAELALLHQLEPLSIAQRTASEERDMDRLARIGDERARLMTGLVQIEADLKIAREAIAARLALARGLPGYADVLARHREAGDLATRIMESDREVLRQLQDAEKARRDAAQAIDAGEATLAAYRRVLTPSVSSVGLINRRG